MKHILLLGAGRSASVLIAYLLQNSLEHNWTLTIGDISVTHLDETLVGRDYANAVIFDVFDEEQRTSEVAKADLVISLLPAAFHIQVALECLKQHKNMITASYVSPEIQALHEQAEAEGLTFMMECGLDPGIDHMSAMQVIHHIKESGGHIFSFKSYTGGLMAPESDTNPWNYKITWNPRNVVLAGQGTAKYLENGCYKYIPYHRLFSRTETFNVLDYGEFEGYANRDSLSYREPYGLQKIDTILRGTFRRKGYSEAWNALVQLGMTDDTYKLENSATMTYAEFTAAYLPAGNEALSLAERTARYLGFPAESDTVAKLNWLGLFSDEMIGLEIASPAQIVEKMLVEKWKLSTGDKDMIVMQHIFDYELQGQKKRMTSSMVVLGEDEVRTAMAKTVGLPVGIAAKLMLQGEITEKGVVMPTKGAVYGPILRELKAHGIHFIEEVTPLEN
ncbi:saccharopine dehydrogenase NADP-binding domain-containing protein [Adhaeribacter sp. BT258]|uniref:Saccharopine dehydrogenase NADP-binding domain-containing protein n=1 Tax=Adhaeribacter terrigena TaxID=2793070 RepID=A0ABS1BY82_9BACT|nr:saccharopine dehydrogenase C-terminal domain-containing protein [Adhaeribacter terrigena]MBK0402109.1 saccharopine dehydrogenase NADP-binding domain-containing protein [Adhaeribacter terrigena]